MRLTVLHVHLNAYRKARHFRVGGKGDPFHKFLHARVADLFIRELLEFERVAAGNPFLSNVQVDPAFLHVTFLYATTSVIILTDLPSPNADGDEYAAGEQAIYLYCPNGYGRTKLSNTYFERKLKVTATTRNWKTVNALLDMARKVDQG